jgi:hypothetical protein
MCLLRFSLVRIDFSVVGQAFGGGVFRVPRFPTTSTFPLLPPMVNSTALPPTT